MVILGGMMVWLPQVALLPIGNVPALDRWILHLLLPPLLFEAAWMLNRHELRADLPPILLLISTGVLVTCFVAAVMLRYIFHWDWAAALLLGAMLSATDPVSVLATLRALHVRGRLPLLLEAESLLNDGSGALLFLIVLSILLGGRMTVAGISWQIAELIAISIAAALVAAVSVLLLMRILPVHMAWSFAAQVAGAYGGYFLADSYGGSGIVAVILIGLVTQSRGKSGNRQLEEMWAAFARATNVGVFLLLGIELMRNLRAITFMLCLAAISVAIFARGAAVAVHGFGLHRSRYAIPAKDQALMIWGGLRGALGLALAVGIPELLPQRQTVLVGTVAIVAFSSLVQAPSMSLILSGMHRNTVE